ncbi:hypothetical protein EVH55_25760 [Salmonella enterica subsp. enterica serovar Benin]|nr:hypothetical protein [Salmonella enterica subsp. enterica serovar Benin]
MRKRRCPIIGKPVYDAVGVSDNRMVKILLGGKGFLHEFTECMLNRIMEADVTQRIPDPLPDLKAGTEFTQP